MKAALKYAVWVLRHKWYVYQECRLLEVGRWQALKHDLTKFSPAEFLPYKNYFNGTQPSLDELRLLYHGRPNDDANVADWKAERQYAFDVAWSHHIHHNPHHWQHWVLTTDTEGTKVLPIPEKYVREMVSDWRGVGRTLNKGRENAVKWYLEHRDGILLHPETRAMVETFLGI